MTDPNLPLFKKLPLGGVDRRMLVAQLAERGPVVARELLAAERARLEPMGAEIGADEIVLVLGGSNGLTRALAVQLVFGEQSAVFAVHYDSEKMQIGPHHARAIESAAAERGHFARFLNADAAKPETVAQVVAGIRERFRVVHLVNGIAAGAPKRHERFGPTRVRELDVAFDPVMQVPDFSQPENVRRLGLVDVEVATAADVERTHRYMGSSTWLWAEALAREGLLAPNKSVVAFCDYDFPPDDPVYGMGPLADAKRAQRESLERISTSFGARVARICYPAMATTALGAIPGGLYLYAVTTQILRERGQWQSVEALAASTMALWRAPRPSGELRLDRAFQSSLDEFRARADEIEPENLLATLGLVIGHP
jgi:enoyl-[acyl-carrier protein] reductase/trans-2-enoyl-CoA reductase (NAD+)